MLWLVISLSLVSIYSFYFNYETGLGLLYNDARSHLDISRRVVENLKPGLAQLGSVWLPLPHFLMLFTIWNDFMWHSGLSGAIQSMISYVITGVIIYLFLRELGVDLFGRVIGVMVFAMNLNIIYMQSTSMTELLLIATITASVYELTVWHRDENLFRLIRVAFWIMLSTLIRYDGWFLFIVAAGFIIVNTFRKYGYKKAEGNLLLFATLAGFGIFLWLFWNLMIFKDPMYFAYGPFSANTQQEALEAAGALPTKHNLLISFLSYFYAMIYNSNPFLFFIASIGLVLLLFDRRVSGTQRFAATALLSPFFFNILALYTGHSSLYVQDIMGSWFNVRYGLMMVPSIAIFAGYFVHRVKYMRYLFLGLFLMISFFSYFTVDSVSMDDAIYGSSGKNVKEVSGWLNNNAKDKEGFVLISVASHDAIIFSSGMPMSRFIHEGTGDYWDYALDNPTKWARWIIMRTNDDNDMTFRLTKSNKQLKNFRRIHRYPFADIYEIKPEFIDGLQTKPVSFANK